MAERLRTRRAELEEAIYARVRAAVADPGGNEDAEYMVGLRLVVGEVLDYGLMGLEHGEEWSGHIPPRAVVQARRAARLGVSLGSVLCRYIAGQALFSDYVMEEADSIGASRADKALRHNLRKTLASLLERLTTSVADAYNVEAERTRHTPDQRRAELVQRLLAGGFADPTRLDLDFDFGGWHLGVIATGVDAGQALRTIAAELDCRLLAVPNGEDTVWAWLGGRRRCTAGDIIGAAEHGQAGSVVSLAIGEPAQGVAGWRLTHRQAQAALRVALPRGAPFTRYADVALLAAVLRDDLLSASLIEIYVSPLALHTSTGATWRQTLCAYVDSSQNISSTASALGVTRQTVENRLHAIEAVLGRPRKAWLPDLALALRALELTDFRSVAKSEPDPN